MSGGVLSGIRVLDATRALAGPFVGMVLGDLGADVIKVEYTGVGDETRAWGPPFATYMGFNRNKRSAEIDFHTKEGQATCLELASTCDVFLENFRPGTVKRFGLDYEAVCRVRPDVIYCSISGYGQSGPLAHRPALDLIIQALSGLMSLTGEPEGRPYRAAAPAADFMGGFSALVSVMAALMERQQTGKGKYLDISMLDGMVTMMGQHVVAYTASGKPFQRWGNAHPLAVPYESFAASDRELVIAVTNDKNWATFCQVPEFAPLQPDPDYASQTLRNKNRKKLIPAVAAIFKTRPAAYWLGEFERLGIAAEPIYELPEILAHPHIEQRGTMVEIEYPEGSGDKVKIPGMPWRAVAAPGAMRNPPTLGQHTQEVLAELAALKKAKS